MSDPLDRLTSAIADRYRLERELGQGGMATVYLAEDLKHHRKVAIKVLHPELSAVIGGERFLAEIKLTASLQHPHILGLIDSGAVPLDSGLPTLNSPSLLYYVMPFIEGETLRARLTREKQLPVTDAIRLTREVASALEFAHKRGIVHRDIKPENILLQDGQALVADFGIALAVQQAGGARMTETGMSLGTPAYMSPEQAMGERDIGPRSDVYALGAVTYEMLTGEPPFTGPNSQAIVAKVLTETPRPLRLVRPSVSPAVEGAVLTALQRLPADRFGTAKEFADALADGSKSAGYAATGVTAASRRPAHPPTRLVGLLAAIALISTAAAAWAWLRPRPAAPVRPVVRFDIQLPQDAQFIGFGAPGSFITFSPDGSLLVYVGKAPSGRQLYVRRMDRPDPVAIQGSEGASLPFFSPDGLSLGFRQGDKLVRVALAGSPVTPIAKVPGATYGASWAPGDTIIFAADSGLMEVPAAGGTPRLIARPDSGEAFRYPEALPDGRAALFGVMSGGTLKLAALTRRTGQVKRFQQQGGYPRYVNGGYVVLSDPSGIVSAVHFDAGRLEVTGAAGPLPDKLPESPDGDQNLGVSRSGDFAFPTYPYNGRRLVLVDRGGTARASGADSGFYATPRLSPDGQRVVLSSATTNAGTAGNAWVLDLKQHTRTRVTFDTTVVAPMWTPDGRRIAYTWFPKGFSGSVGHIYWVMADGSGTPESLLVRPGVWRPTSVQPDGKGLVYWGRDSLTGKFAIWRLGLDGGTAPVQLLANGFNNSAPMLSPDGRWFAYVSDESGRNEVYVRPYPGPGGRWQVSLDGGTEPLWSPRGQEIFYRDGDKMMAVAVRTAGAFEIGNRTALFSGVFSDWYGTTANYDVTRDGQTFIMLQPIVGSAQTVIVTLNWFENLTRTR